MIIKAHLRTTDRTENMEPIKSQSTRSHYITSLLLIRFYCLFVRSCDVSFPNSYKSYANYLLNILFEINKTG